MFLNIVENETLWIMFIPFGDFKLVQYSRSNAEKNETNARTQGVRRKEVPNLTQEPPSKT